MAALFVGLILRIGPLIVWPMLECVRDECIYRSIAYKVIDGRGLTTSSKGWLPAPGFVYLMAVAKIIFGSFQAVKWLHVVISTVTVVLMYLLGHRVSGSRRAARIAAWLFAINPTIAWFTNTLWIETVYIFCLLSAILAVLWSRERSWPAAILPGAMLGMAVLFRGVATYLPPFFILALVWPAGGFKTIKGARASVFLRWQHAIGLIIGLLIVVAPYSVTSSQKHGGFMVSDATVGHVLFLGNNDFPPLTFDYGNGMLTGPLFARYLRTGRMPCDRKRPPVLSSGCEVRAARDWIVEHPDKFARRIPMRLAQMVNPNSFLTRHARWGYFPGMPWWMKELLAVYVALFSALVMVGGTIGAFSKAKGPYGLMAVGTVLYTFLTITVMYGMTRFRLPLEPLWTIYLAMLLANPKGCVQALKTSGPRLAGLLVTLPALLALMLWYLPTGFPMYW
jgi:4-amino-4-deoxy-L-arabinose transferase-like glycosyltransferase